MYLLSKSIILNLSEECRLLVFKYYKAHLSCIFLFLVWATILTRLQQQQFNMLLDTSSHFPLHCNNISVYQLQQKSFVKGWELSSNSPARCISLTVPQISSFVNSNQKIDFFSIYTVGCIFQSAFTITILTQINISMTSEPICNTISQNYYTWENKQQFCSFAFCFHNVLHAIFY